MHAFTFEVVTYDGQAFCTEHCPVSLLDENVQLVFADSEWDSYPVCFTCGKTHSYVSLSSLGVLDEKHRLEVATFLVRRKLLVSKLEDALGHNFRKRTLIKIWKRLKAERS